MYRRSVDDPKAFWAEAAGELDWFAPWTEVQTGDISHATWFTGGKLNLCHNCVDRHANGARRDKVALLWEGERARFASSPMVSFMRKSSGLPMC